jgi:hypothetical protein
MANYFVGDVEFFMAASDFSAAMAALRAAAPTVDRAYGLNGWGRGILEASEGREPHEAIARIFDSCGWEPVFDQDGNIVTLDMSPGGSPDYVAGSNTDPLFDIVAPYVRDGSRVQMLSEDGADVIYHFRGGTCETGAKVDPLDPRRERCAVVSLGLLERIRAYLLASDAVVGGGTGAALAADLEREMSTD